MWHGFAFGWVGSGSCGTQRTVQSNHCTQATAKHTTWFTRKMNDSRQQSLSPHPNSPTPTNLTQGGAQPNHSLQYNYVGGLLAGLGGGGGGRPGPNHNCLWIGTWGKCPDCDHCGIPVAETSAATTAIAAGTSAAAAAAQAAAKVATSIVRAPTTLSFAAEVRQ